MIWRVVLLVCLAWLLVSALTAAVVAAVLRGGTDADRTDLVDH
jgi:hypothetical protein